MKKLSLSLVLVVVLFVGCLLSGGCAVKNELLDEQMRIVVSALNANDVDILMPHWLPEAGDREALAKGLSDIHSFWIPVEADEVKLVRWDKNTKVAADSKTVIYAGIYRLPRTDGAWYLRLTYREADEEKGLIGLYVSQGEEVQGTTRNIAQTVMDLVCLAAAVVTIIDILRHKPRKYGWYILLALFSFRFSSITNGALTFFLRIPLGATVYWCMRRRILAEKAAKATIEAHPADPEPVAFPEPPGASPAQESPEPPQPGDEAE